MQEIKKAWLTTNRSCNNACEWCYAKNAGLKSMDFEKLKKCIDSLSDINVKNVVLIGGEPTLYAHLFDTLHYLKEKGIYVSMASNGRLFCDKDFAKKCYQAGLRSVNISLKAITEADYISLTGKEGFHEAIEGYHNLKKLGINTSLSYVITTESFALEDLINCMKKEKLDDIVFQFVKPTVQLEAAEPIMKMDAMGRVVSAIYHRMKQEQIHYIIEASFPFCFIDQDILEQLLVEKKITNGCHIKTGSGLNFDEKFQVIPCNHFVDFPFQKREIVCKEDIEALYASEEMKTFRKQVNTYISKKCENCKWWMKCGGGCFTRWLYEKTDQI